MSSNTRTRRSEAFVTPPHLFEILERIEENPRESLIFGEVKTVFRYYNGNTDAIAEFWFSTPNVFDLEDENLHFACVLSTGG